MIISAFYCLLHCGHKPAQVCVIPGCPSVLLSDQPADPFLLVPLLSIFQKDTSYFFIFSLFFWDNNLSAVFNLLDHFS